MMRKWKCRKCGNTNWRRFTKCQYHDVTGRVCTGRKPAARVPAHRAALDELPYEWWVEEFGERCGICAREPGSRRLDRDHCHTTGSPRGLLCHRCNRALPSWMTADWLIKAARYLGEAA